MNDFIFEKIVKKIKKRKLKINDEIKWRIYECAIIVMFNEN